VEVFQPVVEVTLLSVFCDWAKAILMDVMFSGCLRGGSNS